MQLVVSSVAAANPAATSSALQSGAVLRTLTICLVFVVLNRAGVCLADEPSDAMRKLAPLIKTGWTKLEECFPQLQVDYGVKSYPASQGSSIDFEAKYTWRNRGADCYLTTTRHSSIASNPKTPDDTAFGGNPSYDFDLACMSGSEKWRLTRASAAPSPSTAVDRVPASQVRRYARPWGHYRTPDGQLLHELFASDDFVADGVGTSPLNAAWIRVSGTRPAKKSENGKSDPRLVGWFDIDPQSGHCCRAMNVLRDYKNYSLGEEHRIEVDKGLCNAALMKLDVVTVSTGTGAAKKDDGRGVWSFDYVLNTNLPEREFTLTAFGLPEPYFASAQRSYLWAYLAAGAVVAAVAAWLIRRRIRKTVA